MVVLDTNIIIDHLRLSTKGKKSVLLRFAENYPKEELAISMITVQELYEGQSTKDEAMEKDMLAVIAPLKILPYSFDTAQKAGMLARDIPRPVELADAAIAASAINANCRLLTMNPKDFISFPALLLHSNPK